MLNGRNRLPQELVRLLTYPANSQPRNGCAIRVRSLTPRAGTIIYYAQQAALSTKTTRSPTLRAVRSTTSPKERHKHSNNLVTYTKSGMVDYFAKGVAQAPQQLGRLPQEWYDRLLHPRSSTSTPTTRSPTPRAVRSTTLPKERHKHSNNLVADPKSSIIKHSTRRTSAINSTTQSSDYFTPRAEQSAKNNSAIYSKSSMVDHFAPKAGTSNKYNSGAYPLNYPAPRMTQIYSTNRLITPRKV